MIFLKDTSAADLTAIVEFMYKGSVNVAQSQLASFIKTAEMLQVQGLSGGDDKDPPPSPSPAPPPPDPSRGWSHQPPPASPAAGIRRLSETAGGSPAVKRRRPEPPAEPRTPPPPPPPPAPPTVAGGVPQQENAAPGQQQGPGQFEVRMARWWRRVWGVLFIRTWDIA